MPRPYGRYRKTLRETAWLLARGDEDEEAKSSGAFTNRNDCRSFLKDDDFQSKSLLNRKPVQFLSFTRSSSLVLCP